jgi:hypothetical protein
VYAVACSLSLTAIDIDIQLYTSQLAHTADDYEPNQEMLFQRALRASGCRTVVAPLCELPALIVRAQHGHRRCIDHRAVANHVVGKHCGDARASRRGASSCRLVNDGRMQHSDLPLPVCNDHTH